MTNPETSQEKQRRFLPWIILALVVVLAIPVGLVALGMISGYGAVPEPCSYCGMTSKDYATATRTGPDSIHIIMRPDTEQHHNQVPTVSIYVNDQEVSNGSLIAASRLDLVINPSEGLIFDSRSSVTLRGGAVAGNESVPVHLQIVATYPDNGRRIAIGEQLL